MKTFVVYAVAGTLKDEPIRHIRMTIEASSLMNAVRIAQEFIDSRPTKLLQITSVNDE